MDFQKKSRLLITCAPGLSEWLRTEIEALGHKVLLARKTGIEIEGTLADSMRLNLWLHTAFAVLYLFEEFACRDAEALYRAAVKLPWEDIIPVNEYISIVSYVENPTINNSMFPNLKLKDAIVDRIMKKEHRRVDSGPERTNTVINLYWKDDRAWLYLNTSGNKLADRGYRRMPHKAPMQETLAAAVMMATGYTGEMPLVAPMCGSGTLAIEGALLAQNRAPGLLRDNFGFMHMKGFNDEPWKAVRREAIDAGEKKRNPRIIATDIYPAAVEAARKNAANAGVEHLIEFGVCDFAETPLPPPPFLVVMNPEYGKRMGELSQLEQVYARIGDFFKQKCQGLTAYVFTGNLDLAKKVHLTPSRKFPFFNADIDCRLLKYEMYAGSRRKDRRQPPGTLGTPIS
jgi:putative N6-adenine-specific DNA methylase